MNMEYHLCGTPYLYADQFIDLNQETTSLFHLTSPPKSAIIQ